ncbi:MAG: hypothetical protein QOE96_2587 [Blastocatellia bacterium]|jgi:hypothetical protein|nr:hypothetical protein [Blastocatellia bacterium]
MNWKQKRQQHKTANFNLNDSWEERQFGVAVQHETLNGL